MKRSTFIGPFSRIDFLQEAPGNGELSVSLYGEDEQLAYAGVIAAAVVIKDGSDEQGIGFVMSINSIPKDDGGQIPMLIPPVSNQETAPS